MDGIRVVLVSVVMLAAWAIGHTEDASQDRAKLALRAEGLLLSRCAVCHSTDLISQQRFDWDRWEGTIQKMIHWGADISPEEAVLLVSYLSARYHPTAPDQEPVRDTGAVAEPLRMEATAAGGHLSSVAGRGEGLYAHNCQACHGSGASGGMGPKLAGNPILGDESRFRDTVLYGRGAMPPWEAALSAQDIADIRAWLQAIK